VKIIENKGFLTTPNAMGRSVAVKAPSSFKNADEINGFEHISCGTALKKNIKTKLNSLFIRVHPWLKTKTIK
jgi:hypothetical protein